MVENISITAIALILGWVMDLAFGDPETLPHPIVYFGKWISFWEKKLNKNHYIKLKGALLAILSIALTYILSKLLIDFISFQKIINTLVQATLIFFCLAGKTLRKEVKEVFRLVDRDILQARKALQRIVGRDTASLSENEVRTAALETLSENLSDGVIAPLFFLAIFGLPGMLAYKMINTLDSMIGYKTKRYKDFGLFAARIDDVANFIPSRLTALIMIVVGWIYLKASKSFFYLVRFTLHYGPKHSSPNAGWPEAALAGILDCRFGGENSYFGQKVVKPYIGKTERLISNLDLKISISVCFFSECLAIIITFFCLV